MAKPLQRVVLHGTTNKYTTVESGATNGADLGINFYYNGVLVRPEDILNLTPTSETAYPITLWRNILEIPPNVTALAETNTTGLYVITGPGGSVTRTLISGPGVDWLNGDGVAGNPQPVFNSNTAPIDRISGSTYSTVQDFVDTMHSPGIILGGEITDIGSGSVRILAGSMMIRTVDDDVSPMPFADFAQTDFLVPNDQLTRFFGVVYNAGAPIVEMRTSYNWNKDTEIPLGSAVRLSTTITNVTPNKYRMGDPITNVIQRFDASSPAIRDNSLGGLLLGEAGVRNVTLTAGKIWSRLSDFDSAAKNSSVDTMLSVYFNGVNLTVNSGITQWDNLNYNTGGALVVMGNNKWANLWFFISIDGTKYGYAYGTGEHNSLGAAANEGLPFYLNQNFFNQTLLLGRFVFQKGAATAGLIESAFTSIFNTSAVNNHNDLAGLQGGAVGEYYHLTALQNTDVTNMSAGGTTGQFWRGDKAWSNQINGDFVVNTGEIRQQGVTTTNNLFRVTGHLQNNSTSSMNIASFQTNVSPQGATLGTLFGLLFVPTLATGACAISTAISVFARLDSVGGFTGSLATYRAFHAAAPVLTISVTTYIGMRIDDTSAATTTTRALDLMMSSGTGKHNVYAQGTAPNYFAGNVGCGIAAPATALHVVGNITQAGGRLETGVVSPAQLTANTDNWAVTGISTAAIIRASTDASRNLTGIASPTSGQVVRLINIGTQDLVLVHDATSTAANRFLLPNSANLTLNPNDSVSLWYDNTSSRWRALGV